MFDLTRPPHLAAAGSERVRGPRGPVRGLARARDDGDDAGRAYAPLNYHLDPPPSPSVSEARFGFNRSYSTISLLASVLQALASYAFGVRYLGGFNKWLSLSLLWEDSFPSGGGKEGLRGDNLKQRQPVPRTTTHCPLSTNNATKNPSLCCAEHCPWRDVPSEIMTRPRSG